MNEHLTAERRFSGTDHVPEPREKRRTPISYIVFSLFVTLLGLAVMAGLALFFGAQRLAIKGPLQEPRTVAIERGMSTAAISRKLAENGVVSNERLFFLAAMVEGRIGKSLKAGEYRFEPGDSMRQVLGKVTSGKALAHKLTIPEGLTSQQVLARVAAHEVLTGDPPASLPEGSVLPDTYVFSRGMTRADLVQKMRDAQTALLDELWDKRTVGLLLASREEAVTLASIVEKETGVAAERRRVAAVFHNRLLRKMRLQSDPTIIYGLVGGKGKLDRPIRRSEIDRKTPYNTYQIDGLPPTPIANPGREAIAAVLNPASSDELYFVADGSGGHVFARTLAEHNANVRRWRKIEAERKLARANTAAQTPETPAGDEPAAAGQSDAALMPEPVPEAAREPDTGATDEQAAEATSNATPADAADQADAPAPDAELPVAGGDLAVENKVARTKVPLPRRKPALN